MITPQPPHYSDVRRNWSLLLVLLMMLNVASAAQDRAAAASAQFFEQVEQRVTALTNEVRQQTGLQPLEPETRLADAARYFAGYLASTGKLDHDADGTLPAERVKKRGYSYCMVAENLASEYSSAGFTPEALSRNFVEGWRQSPTHRENMLLADITQIGVGVARSAKDGEYFAVQVFARPMSAMVKFRVTNRSNATVRYEFRKRPVTLGPKQGRLHESCVASELRLETGGQDASIRARDGARYVITETGRGVFRFQEE
jgi:uncharacterized protein YkwD